MRRGHRSFHRVIWPVLLAIVAVVFALALVLRPSPAPAATVVMETVR